MVIRNPHLKENIRRTPAPPQTTQSGYSFDYWNRKAHEAGPGKATRLARALRTGVLVVVALVILGIIGVVALDYQQKDIASLDCDPTQAQKASNSLLALGGCKKVR